jgi:hypothetical protein
VVAIAEVAPPTRRIGFAYKGRKRKGEVGTSQNGCYRKGSALYFGPYLCRQGGDETFCSYALWRTGGNRKAERILLEMGAEPSQLIMKLPS